MENQEQEWQKNLQIPLPNPPSYFPFMYMPWITVPNPQLQPQQSGEKKKYRRTWSRKQIEQLYLKTKEYCAQASKLMEDLTLEDFEVIDLEINQGAEMCMKKVREVMSSGTLRPGVWSEQEDSYMKELLQAGKQKWGAIASLLNEHFHKGLRVRTGKQCKERWSNHLNPDINRGPWTPSEDLKLLECYSFLGNKWSLIAKRIANRTESSVKNRVKSMLNKEKQNLSTLQKPQDVVNFLIEKKRQELGDKDSASPPSGSQNLASSFSMAVEKFDK